MILICENGKLGNQLFQYFGLKNYFPNHQLFFFGFDSISKLFNNLEGHFFDVKKKYQIFRFIKITLLFLTKIRLIGTINEQNFAWNVPSHDFKIIVKKGLFWNIFFAQHLFLQDKKTINKINNQLLFKKEIINIAVNWLKKKKINLEKSNLIFVHIRRGNYLYWPHPNFPAALDLSWYLKLISYLKKKISQPIFILMGDDLFFIKRHFKKSKYLIISENSPEIDLAIMTKCSHGIMSPSTFAWWGCYFIKSTKVNKKKSYFIAPKFWAGHGLKKWLPYKNFIFKWIMYRSYN